MTGLARPLPGRPMSLDFGPTNPNLAATDNVWATKEGPDDWVRARINKFTEAGRVVKQYDDFHLGTDYDCPVGTPVLAPEAGTIVAHSYDRWGGYTVRLQIQDGTYFGAGHLSAFVGKIGKKVKRGAVIAKTGNTGITTGPNCHCFIAVSFAANANEARWYDNWFRIDIEKCYAGGEFADRDWLKPG